MYDSADNDDLVGGGHSDSPSSIPHGFCSDGRLHSGGGPHSVDLNLQGGISRSPNFRIDSEADNSIGGNRFEGKQIQWNSGHQVVVI